MCVFMCTTNPVSLSSGWSIHRWNKKLLHPLIGHNISKQLQRHLWLTSLDQAGTDVLQYQNAPNNKNWLRK